MSDTSGPPNPTPELELQSTSSHQADALKRPVRSKAALDILHFFTGVSRNRSKHLPTGEPLPPKICKLCSYVRTFWYLFCFLTTSSEKHGTEKSTTSDDVANYIYGPNTGNSNLWNHLCRIHPEEYDKAVLQHKWEYKLSAKFCDPTTHASLNKRDRELPSFSLAAFLEHLVRFVIANDQVSPNDPVFFHTHKSSVDSRCRMPRISKFVYGSLRESRRHRHTSPW